MGRQPPSSNLARTCLESRCLLDVNRIFASPQKGREHPSLAMAEPPLKRLRATAAELRSVVADLLGPEHAPVNIFEVVKELFACASDEGLSAMELQKLLYFVAGVYLALTGKPLFMDMDDFEAWKHGPVHREVYAGRRSIGMHGSSIRCKRYPEHTDDNAVLPDGVRLVAYIVSAAHHNQPAWFLRQISHEPGSPWHMAYDPDPAMTKNCG